MKNSICIICKKPCDIRSKSKRCRICCMNYYKLKLIKKHPIDLSITPENMYFWGFLWADGHISKPENNNRVSLGIVSKDFKSIENIIPSQFNIYYYNPSNPKWQQQTTAVYNKFDYVEFLRNNGYSNKQHPTKLLIYNDISHYWFRGVIDGDGCWYFNKKHGLRQFTLTSHYNQNWDYFTNKLDELKCSYKIIRMDRGNSKRSLVRMCNKQNLGKLHNYLYPNGFDFGLKRKYNKSLLTL